MNYFDMGVWIGLKFKSWKVTRFRLLFLEVLIKDIDTCFDGVHDSGLPSSVKWEGFLFSWKRLTKLRNLEYFGAKGSSKLLARSAHLSFVLIGPSGRGVNCITSWSSPKSGKYDTFSEESPADKSIWDTLLNSCAAFARGSGYSGSSGSYFGNT